jgi:hypothetical protein
MIKLIQGNVKSLHAPIGRPAVPVCRRVFLSNESSRKKKEERLFLLLLLPAPYVCSLLFGQETSEATETENFLSQRPAPVPSRDCRGNSKKLKRMKRSDTLGAGDVHKRQVQRL